MVTNTVPWPKPPPIGYRSHAAAVRAWILRTPVEELADYILAGVDINDPPFELLADHSPPGAIHGPPRPPMTKTPSGGPPYLA